MDCIISGASVHSRIWEF